MTLYNKDNWGIIEQYFKGGVEHIQLMDFVRPITACYPTGDQDEINLERLFTYLIGKPYFDHLVYMNEPMERVEGFVYYGIRILRTFENEERFKQIERTIEPYPYKTSSGFLREIWELHYREDWRGYKQYTKNSDGSISVTKLEDSIAA